MIVEKVGLAWVVFTSVLILVMWPHLASPWQMVGVRIAWIAATLLLARIASISSPLGEVGRGLLFFLRTAAALAWLSVFYPETYEFNRWRDNFDWWFAEADWHLFGCQPALEMSKLLDSPWWSEAFNLGYFSYFPMIAILIIAIALSRSSSTILPSPLLPRVGAVILASFFIYYTIYIALPVAGPQFYFAAIGPEAAAQGIYPKIGTYFDTQTAMLPAPGWTDGFFYKLVALTQHTGERPTAAFPSSHIGIATIVLILALRHARRVVPLLLPLCLLLYGATIYIQAHYLVDAIAGLITAPIVLWLASRLTGYEFKP